MAIAKNNLAASVGHMRGLIQRILRPLGVMHMVVLAAGLWLATAPAAFALSEIPEEDVKPSPDVITVPLPPPLANPANSAEDEMDDEPDDDGDMPSEAVAPADMPEIFYDLALLPKPVQRMRQLILDACKAGDIEALKPLLGLGDNGTMLTDTGSELDRIDYLKDISGDGEGHEIMAILEEVLEAGYVHLDAGEPEEIYLWPYFFAVPLETLTAPQRVELFRLVTAGDYEDMKSFGSYIFYRAGITPEGRWAFFLAGH